MIPFALGAINMYFQLPVLIVVISLVYSGTRYDAWDSILHEAVRWGGRMALFLVGIGVVLYLIASFPITTVLLVLAPVAIVFVVYVLMSERSTGP